MNPLKSIQGTIVAGAVLALIIGWAVGGFVLVELSWFRWIHILAGITWIGLLYYFNFVQVPALAMAAADKGGPGGAGIGKDVAPLALLWFRMAARLTWLTGALPLSRRPPGGGALVGAPSLALLPEPRAPYLMVIGI